MCTNLTFIFMNHAQIGTMGLTANGVGAVSPIVVHIVGFRCSAAAL